MLFLLLGMPLPGEKLIHQLHVTPNTVTYLRPTPPLIALVDGTFSLLQTHIFISPLIWYFVFLPCILIFHNLSFLLEHKLFKERIHTLVTFVSQASYTVLFTHKYIFVKECFLSIRESIALSFRSFNL